MSSETPGLSEPAVDPGSGPAGTAPSDALRAQLADQKVTTYRPDRATSLARLCVILAVAGLALSFFGYLQSHSAGSVLNQNEARVVSVIGVTCTVVGGIAFLRYSLGQFLRLWIARLIHELDG